MKASPRLNILVNSLTKKEFKFDEKLKDHFQTVAASNGQPLNDKRNGASTLSKWNNQNNALRTLAASIETTKAAIERESAKIASVVGFDVPLFLQADLDSGAITQWRKYPNTFFVAGVAKGRIVLKDGALFHRYLSMVSKDEYPTFRDTFNRLNALNKASTT